MSAASSIVLRDIHQPPAPPWWPPAPGWWLLAALLLASAVGFIAWREWKRRRLRRIEALFDDELARAVDPPARLAAMSALLRRAARRVDPAADRLQGEAWRELLDADAKAPRFGGAAGDLLVEGPFRRAVAEADVDALRPAVRARFLEWMQT